MYPERRNLEETGLNSSHLKYLLIPCFKQLWFSGFTWTTQSNAKLRKSDSAIFVRVLYVLRIYSWWLQIETGFLKTCSLPSKNSIQVYYQTETTQAAHTEKSGLGVAVWLCSLFLLLLSPSAAIAASPTSRQPSDEVLLYSQCSNVIFISPAQESVSHLNQHLVSRCQGFTPQPEVHADLHISSSSFSLGSLLTNLYMIFKFPYSNSHTHSLTERFTRQTETGVVTILFNRKQPERRNQFQGDISSRVYSCQHHRAQPAQSSSSHYMVIDSQIWTSPLLQETVFRFGNTHWPISGHRSPSESSFFVLFVSICRLNSFPRTEHSKFKIYFFTLQQRWKCSTRGAKKILAKAVDWPDLGSTATYRSQPVPRERGVQLGRRTKTKMASK